MSLGFLSCFSIHQILVPWLYHDLVICFSFQNSKNPQSLSKSPIPSYDYCHFSLKLDCCFLSTSDSHFVTHQFFTACGYNDLVAISPLGFFVSSTHSPTSRLSLLIPSPDASTLRL